MRRLAFGGSLAIWVLGLATGAWANQVPNGSFESGACPTSFNCDAPPTGWSCIESVDTYAPCGAADVSVPDNLPGFQYAFKGSRYTGMQVAVLNSGDPYGEYLQRSIAPLSPGI